MFDGLRSSAAYPWLKWYFILSLVAAVVFILISGFADPPAPPGAP